MCHAETSGHLLLDQDFLKDFCQFTQSPVSLSHFQPQSKGNHRRAFCFLCMFNLHMNYIMSCSQGLSVDKNPNEDENIGEQKVTFRTTGPI